MAGIPRDLNRDLRTALLACEPFESDGALRAVFRDARIVAWQATLTAAPSLAARVTRTVDYLAARYDAEGESALVLLLRVLADQTPPETQCYQRLSALIPALKVALDLGKPGSPTWESALARYRAAMRHRHGRTRVFGQTQPVPLESIFTHVYILEQPQAFRRFDIRHLRTDPRALDRAQRVPGQRLIRRPCAHRLFLLGKPGAGKTTFLKHLVLQTADGHIGRVPLFVTLREWSDSGLPLMEFVVRQAERCGLDNARPIVEHVLEQGEALVLFDGLDEVRREGGARRSAFQALKDFSQRYPQSQIVITCRNAATEYTFEAFTYVEIADFTQSQMETFAEHWFRQHPDKCHAFLDELNKPEHRGLRELGRTPLLMGLLCLHFDETLSFPQRRVELYEEALDALLKKWDAKRAIQRDQEYRKLSLGRKRQMLAYLAAETFWSDAYFLRQREVERYIVTYLHDLPPVDLMEDIDAEAVLKAIEAHHGILVERAHRIYSFAHLTFQEYYTARDVIDDTASGDRYAIPRLLAHAHEDRWHEVILLTASMLSDASAFFRHFLGALDELVREDEALTAFLAWAARKAAAVNISPPAALRGYYTWLALEVDPALDLARALDDTRDLNLALDLDRALDLALDLARQQTRATDLDRALSLSRTLGLDALRRALETLRAPADASPAAWQAFAERLRAIMVDHRDIGHRWSFTDAQRQRLRDYFYAAHLLVKCLDLAYVTERASIKARLLLPPDMECDNASGGERS